jgi:hypothetical protein
MAVIEDPAGIVCEAKDAPDFVYNGILPVGSVTVTVEDPVVNVEVLNDTELIFTNVDSRLWDPAILSFKSAIVIINGTIVPIPTFVA